MVKFVCAETGKEVESENCVLPPGWIIPPSDISLDIDKPQPPYGTVIAFSSESAFKKCQKRRLEEKLNSGSIY